MGRYCQTPQEDLTAIMSDPMEDVVDAPQESAHPAANEPEEQMEEEPAGDTAEIEDENSKNSEDKQEETESGVTEDVELEAPAVAAEEKTEKLTKFPLGRVKHIMKMDPDLTMASQESVFLVSKALEMFVESLAREAYGYTERAKKKTVAKTDVDKAIDTADCLAFLEGAMDD